jgi:hypothetical protein
MYVKWEDRLNRTGTAAVLVEAQRIEGKPRQRHIAYLGTYTNSLYSLEEGEYHDEHNVHRRAWFWHGMTQRLAKLNLSAEQRSHIKTLVAKRLPKPTEAEITVYDQKERARIRKHHGWPDDANFPGAFLHWPSGTQGAAKPPPRKGPRFPAVLAAVQGAR